MGRLMEDSESNPPGPDDSDPDPDTEQTEKPEEKPALAAAPDGKSAGG